MSVAGSRAMVKVLACLFVFAASGFSTAGYAEHLVALDEPGVLQAMEVSNPSRYDLIRAVLDAAEAAGCGDNLSTVLKSRFGVTSAYCANYLMSDPPKWRLVFRLGDVRYSILRSPRDYPR
jgi:hypothetical protein